MTALNDARANRLLMLDVWRFIAAVAIVWLHTCSDGYLAATTAATRFAVPFFSAAAIFLLYRSVQRKPETSFGTFAARRVRRLYFPFLGWSGVYFVSTNLKRHFVSHQRIVPIGFSFFWAGTSLQLWFLPFLMVVMLAAFGVCRWMVRLKAGQRNGFAILLAVMGLAFCFFSMPWSGPSALGDDVTATRYVLNMSWGTLPAVFWGLAFAAFSRRAPAWVGLCVFFPVTAAIYFPGSHPVLENLAGVSALAAACADWDSLMIRKLAQFGSDAYGIYLAHVLFIEGMFALVQRAGIGNSILLKLVEFAVALVVSFVLVRLLGKSRWTNWMNG